MARNEKKINYAEEVKFANGHPGHYYQPANFHFGKESYRPDFYDPVANVFYEVIGTRQRWHQLKVKGKLGRFIEAYPNIKLIICDGDGELYPNSRKKWIDFDGRILYIEDIENMWNEFVQIHEKK